MLVRLRRTPPVFPILLRMTNRGSWFYRPLGCRICREANDRSSPLPCNWQLLQCGRVAHSSPAVGLEWGIFPRYSSACLGVCGDSISRDKPTSSLSVVIADAFPFSQTLAVGPSNWHLSVSGAASIFASMGTWLCLTMSICSFPNLNKSYLPMHSSLSSRGYRAG